MSTNPSLATKRRIIGGLCLVALVCAGVMLTCNLFNELAEAPAAAASLAASRASLPVYREDWNDPAFKAELLELKGLMESAALRQKYSRQDSWRFYITMMALLLLATTKITVRCIRKPLE